jgi:hypothetical protein
MINIRCSIEPFRWSNRHDWLELIAIYGAIHQVLRDSLSLSLSEPLIHASPAYWAVNQVEINYDIPDSNSKGSFILQSLVAHSK